MGSKRSRATSHVGLLQNWNRLNASLMDLKESDVARLLSHERKNRKRITFLLRLQARLNKLRNERERIDLVRSAGKNTVLLPGDE